MSIIEANTLIIGASISGLACAAALRKNQIEFTIIEKEKQLATPWRNHYERLHLHTNKRISSLPYSKFGKRVSRYPSRAEVVEYLDKYAESQQIQPVFSTAAISVKKEGDDWITQTTNGLLKSKFVIMATGAYGTPKPIVFKGMQSFPGPILHSSQYTSGGAFKGKNVLVIGFGNSACEIAIDLFEQRAFPSMSIRSAVNVIPRDVLGIPILELSLLMSHLPPRVADRMNAPLMNLLVGDITKLGLRKLPFGPLEQIRSTGTVPVLDIGTISHIREGHIQVHGEIQNIEGNNIHFVDGEKKEFDAIVAAIGFNRNYEKLLQVDPSRFDDLRHSLNNQEYFGKDGLYFCGYWVSPTGQIREIARDSKAIAKDIAKKINSSI
jgi:cation diffusion facilitator CzcD-associated flavoprotein CzcO